MSPLGLCRAFEGGPICLEESNMKLFKLNSHTFAVVTAIALAAVTAAPANGDLILDQESPVSNAYCFSGTSLNWQQEVVVGLDGPLAGFELYAWTPGSAIVYINAGAPWQDDVNEFEITVSPSSIGWFFIDTADANINFDVGDHFVIGLQGTGGGLKVGGSSPGPYPEGMLYVDGDIHVSPDYIDFGFRTYVPEPGSLFLLSLGALAALRRLR